MNAKNFTPHPVTLISEGGKSMEIPSVGVCRAQSTQGRLWTFDLEHGRKVEAHGPTGPTEIEINSPPRFRGLEWVPAAPEEGPVIVSIVAAPVVAAERPDLTVYVPDTGPGSAVRDTGGHIRGVRKLILWHRPEPTPIQLIECLNPANPYDGWSVLETYEFSREGLEAGIVEIFDRGNPLELLLDIPGGQPFAGGWIGEFSAERRKAQLDEIWDKRVEQYKRSRSR